MSTIDGQRTGGVQECLNSTVRRCTMPAFTFEKISPPVRRGPIAPIEQKQRGVIVQMLDRLGRGARQACSRSGQGRDGRPRFRSTRITNPQIAFTV
ncbi:hypothetical protein ACVWY2_003670 [Bradyrhizobium sp. JR6.1]